MDTPREERQWSLWLPLRQTIRGFALESGEPVLEALGESIRISGERANEVSRGGQDPNEYPTDYVDAVVDQECDFIEQLLGVSFVVCQTFITEVVSNVDYLHRKYERYFPGKKLSSTPTKKAALMQFGSPTVGDSSHSQVTVIDAFANYYAGRLLRPTSILLQSVHPFDRDEWTLPWNRMIHDHQKRTAAIIGAVGASEGSTETLVTEFLVVGLVDLVARNLHGESSARQGPRR